MSLAQIRVEANETITIDGKTYRVAEHPALPSVPYVQRGARGFVIQLIAPDGERMALKYFKLKYRVPELVTIAQALRHYADLPGLRAARRTVFTQATHAALLQRYPALEYGMLMPWLPGTTWYDVITTKTPLTPQDSINVALETSRVLAMLEDKGLAHCDVAGANVMVDRRAKQIELVDIEEMYGPDMPSPVEVPAGQDGYQHRTSRQQGQWSAVGDRFGAAVLLAEMLAWTDARVRQNSADEHYFSSAEMQSPDSGRYRLLAETLRDHYGEPGKPIVESFEAAWRSSTLNDCPPLSQWREALGQLPTPAPTPTAPSNGVTNSPPINPNPVISGRRAIGVSIPNVTPPTAPAPIPDPVSTTIPSNPDYVPARMQLEGIRLCRNCGAQNSSTDPFCKRCGFYIGTGARPRVPVYVPVSGGVKAAQVAQATGQVPPQPNPAIVPQSVALNRDNESIISARRVGAPGQGMQRIVSPDKEKEAPADANFGSWIVVALIIGAVLTILVLALLAK